MKVFICWSEGRSKKIAEELRTWLKMVIQQIDPWMSDEDIRAGARWHSEITSNLGDCKVGIICLTSENLKSEWIHFEAGALSKTVEKTYICPLLIGGLDSRDVPYPLAQFQSKKADKDGVFDIVKTINSVLDNTISLSDDMLKKTFDRWWPDLEKIIRELPAVAADKTKRKPEEMLEEILNSVRAISNMISEQGLLKTIFSPGYSPLTYADIMQLGLRSLERAVRSSKLGEAEVSDPVNTAINILTKSEALAADKKKTE